MAAITQEPIKISLKFLPKSLSPWPWSQCHRLVDLLCVCFNMIYSPLLCSCGSTLPLVLLGVVRGLVSTSNVILQESQEVSTGQPDYSQWRNLLNQTILTTSVCLFTLSKSLLSWHYIALAVPGDLWRVPNPKSVL